MKNILSNSGLNSIVGGDPQYVPIYDENGNIIGWRIAESGEDPLKFIIPPFSIESY